MKTITFSIDLKSFFVGALTVVGILTLTNFTPGASTRGASTPGRSEGRTPAGAVDAPRSSASADKGQPDPVIDTRRFQALTESNRTVVLDTKTGRFIYTWASVGQSRWYRGDFEEIYSQDKK